MATLQTAQQNSAFIAKSRLNHVVRDQQPRPKTVSGEQEPELIQASTLVTHIPASVSRAASPQRFTQLSELEQHKLLIQTATTFTKEWRLVFVQKQADTNVLVAWLVRNRESGDPSVLVRHGFAMSIHVDAMGEIRINQPQHRGNHRSFRNWFRKLIPFI